MYPWVKMGYPWVKMGLKNMISYSYCLLNLIFGCATKELGKKPSVKGSSSS